MFTGIVQGKARVSEFKKEQGLATLILKFPAQACTGLQIGASVAIEGCCLTAVAINHDFVTFNLIQETLQLTSLGNLHLDDEVNYERSARFGDEIGGHILSGHVHGVATLQAIEKPVNNWILTLKLPKHFISYVFAKGYIALAGCSLTVVKVDKEQNLLTVHLIPETLAITTLGQKKVGDIINFEVDAQTIAIVDTVAAYLTANNPIKK